MRLTLAFGRLIVIDFTLLEINDPDDKPDTVVIHHFNDDDTKDDPGDLFGGK
jgi:hypothetical protein